MEYASAMDLRGWTAREIANGIEKEFGTKVSSQMVRNYLRKIRKVSVANMIRDRNSVLARSLQQYRDVRKVAWEAFEMSRKDEEKMVDEFAIEKEKIASGDFVQIEKAIKRMHERRTRLPSPQYLQIIMDTFRAERELLGIDEEMHKNLMKIEDTERVIQKILDSQRDVLASHPELLHKLRERCYGEIQEELQVSPHLRVMPLIAAKKEESPAVDQGGVDGEPV